MIGKLQYVVHTRPGIELVVGMVASSLENPKENYMMAIKRNMRYLKGTEDYGLWYKLRGNLDLEVFTNADWARSLDDRKRISSGAFFLGKKTSILDKQEEKLHIPIHNGRRVYGSSNKLF